MQFLLIICLAFLQDIPFKSDADFVIEIDYKLKPRNKEQNTVILFELEDRTSNRALSSTTELPYLVVNLIIKNHSEDEVRVRTSNNMEGILFTKKVELNKKYRIDFGFTDDVKDNVTSNELHNQPF
ncbi:MAG: hypothetical protein HC811_01850 [Flammeovirgaceae bacterium]|nr:hypothetical protein [Flammeovirgaceae bacterium]